MRLHTFLLLGFTVIHLPACAYFGRNMQRAGTEIHEGTVAFDQRVRDWLYSEDREMEAIPPKPHEGYCYRTLGEVSCYPHPVAGQSRRMVGLQMPDPAFDALNTPVPVERPLLDYREIKHEPIEQAQTSVVPKQVEAKPLDAYEAELSGTPVIVETPSGKDAVLLPMIQPQTSAPQPLLP